MKGKINKKKIALFAILGILVLSTFGIWAVAANVNKPVINLSDTAIEMDVTDVYTMEYETEHIRKTLEWTSTDESVATVSEGVIRAKKEGQTTIIASAGKVQATCTVTVTDSKSAPRLVLDYNNVTLGLNYSFNVKPRVYWKGDVVEDDIEYTWELIEGCPSDVVSLEQQDGQAVITGLKYGETAFRVRANYRGTVLVKQLNVCVTNVDVIFDSPNMEMSAGCYTVNLGLVETEKDITSLVPEIYVYDNEELVENPKFTWENSDDSIAVMDKSGRITAKKAGTTVLLGTYGESKIQIQVNVYRTEISMDLVYIEDVKNYTISISKLKGQKVEEVFFGEKALNFTYNTKKGSFKFNTDTLPEIGTSGMLVIQTNKAVFTMEARIVTLAINDENELNQMASVIKEKEGYGYYVLADDIHYKGEYDSDLVVDFRGTFDGACHTIYDLVTSNRNAANRGLLGQMIEKEGVVKDVSFVNAKHGGMGGLISAKARGTMNNVYVQIDITNFTDGKYEAATSALASSCNGGFRTKNVLVEYIHPLPTDATSGHALNFLFYGYANKEAIYVIGADKVATYEEKIGDRPGDDFGAYANYGEFLDASIDVSKWDEKFWTITNNIPYPKNLGVRKGIVPKVTLPKYVGNNSSVVLEGMTVCDRVITNSTMQKYGIVVKNGMLVIPKNVPAGTKLTIKVQSVFDTSKQITLNTEILESKYITIDKIQNVELGQTKSFDLDLTEKSNVIGNATFTQMTVDGVNVSDAVYKNGKVTIKTADLGDLGEKSVRVFFKDSKNLIVISICVDACTMSIETEEDLNRMASVIEDNEGAGRYVLANDIVCKGVYDANLDTAFTGVFEGHGYTIYHMTTSDRNATNRGLFGATVESTAIVRNVSFVDAKHGGNGGFITSKLIGKLENIYVQIAITDEYGDGDASVLATKTYGQTKTRNVLVEYINPLSKDATVGYAMNRFYYGAAKHQGFYAVGAENLGVELHKLDYGLEDDFAAHKNYADFIAANHNLDGWDKEFWTVKNNVPYPKNLAARKNAVPTVSIPEYVAPGQTVSIEGVTVCDELILDGSAKKLGVTMADDQIKVPNTVPVGTVIRIVARSAFDATKSVTLQTTVLGAKNVALENILDIVLYKNNAVQVNLGEYTDEVEGASLIGVTIEGDTFKGATYDNEILTLDTKAFSEFGEMTMLATFRSSNYLVNVSIPINVCTWAIRTEEDLNRMASVIEANEGAGYYVLKNDIVCEGVYDANLDTAFTGVFDGHGYTIYHMTTSNRNATNRGLFGATVESTAIVRNVSFVDAKHGGNGGFITSKLIGKLENIYVQIAITDEYGDGDASVLATKTYGQTKTRNVLVEYINPLSKDATVGYAMNRFYYGAAKHQGFYVVGAENLGVEINELEYGLEDDFAAHKNYADFIAANHNLDGWDKEFWTIKNNVPYPKNLEARESVVPDASIPENIAPGETVSIKGVTVCDVLILDESAKQFGVTMEDNKIKVPNTVPEGTVIQIVAHSAFDSAKSITLQTTVTVPKQLTYISWNAFGYVNGEYTGDDGVWKVATTMTSLDEVVFDGDIVMSAPSTSKIIYGDTGDAKNGVCIRLTSAGYLDLYVYDNGAEAYYYRSKTPTDYGVDSFTNQRFNLKIQRIQKTNDTVEVIVLVNDKQYGETCTYTGTTTGNQLYTLKVTPYVPEEYIQTELTKISWADFDGATYGTAYTSKVVVNYKNGTSLNNTSFEDDVAFMAGGSIYYAWSGSNGLNVGVNSAGQFVITQRGFYDTATEDYFTYTYEPSVFGLTTVADTRIRLRIDMVDVTETSATVAVYVNGIQAGENIHMYSPGGTTLGASVRIYASNATTAVTLYQKEDNQTKLTKITWADFDGATYGTAYTSKVVVNYKNGTSLNNTSFEDDVAFMAGGSIYYAWSGSNGLNVGVNSAGQFVITQRGFYDTATEDYFTYTYEPSVFGLTTVADTRIRLRIDMVDVTETSATVAVYVNGIQAGENIHMYSPGGTTLGASVRIYASNATTAVTLYQKEDNQTKLTTFALANTEDSFNGDDENKVVSKNGNAVRRLYTARDLFQRLFAMLRREETN